MQYRQKRTTRKTLLAIAIGASVATASATAADSRVETAADDSWISVSGEVESVTPDAFVLDYGDGEIVVEMDDWDSDADGYKLIAGDNVTVLGIVDDDLLERRTIEASSVYVESLSTYFYASPADEEDAYVAFVPMEKSGAYTVQGTVTEIDDDEIVINTGLLTLDVNLDELGYDPLDDEGFQKIEVGDRVSVTGDMAMQFFVDHDLIADSIVTLSNRTSS